MSASAFLIRRSPLAGESLSSFRQRVGWANGFRLFPAHDERRRRTDHDRTIGFNEDEWLAALHQTDVAVLRRLTLQRWEGVLHPREVKQRMPAWWTCSRYGPNQPNYGPMVCHACLATDPDPYFRLEWRLGFVTHCSVHCTLLHDRCFECGSAPWPTGIAVFEHLNPSFDSFSKCWHCAATSRTAPVAPQEVANEQHALLKWLDSPGVALGSNHVPAYEAFAALREMCQLFWRSNSATTIARSHGPYAAVAEAVLSAQQNCNRIELLPVALRAKLLPAAHQVLQDWPDRFLEFAASHDISRQFFFGAKHRLPSWMRKEVDTRLAKQNRFVTVENVREAFDHHRHQYGTAPLKADLIRRLGAGCRKALAELYQQRSRATEEEASLFYRQYCCIRERALRHGQRRNPFIFNAAAVAAQLVGVLEESAISWSPTRLNLLLYAPSARMPIGECRSFVDRARDDLRQACTENPCWAKSYRGNKRAVRDCLRGIFLGMPSDLAFEVTVFAVIDRRSRLNGL